MKNDLKTTNATLAPNATVRFESPDHDEVHFTGRVTANRSVSRNGDMVQVVKFSHVEFDREPMQLVKPVIALFINGAGLTVGK